MRLLGPLCIDRVDAPRGSRRRTLLRMACEAGRTEVAAILVDELGKGLGTIMRHGQMIDNGSIEQVDVALFRF